MGKIAVPSKRTETINKSTRVIKQATYCKPQHVRYKRLLMFQRRLDNVINERNSFEEQNKDLSDALKAEKLLSASLKKESFHWQRLYHESAITVNSYKVKQFEMAEALSLCLREIDSIYPNMVAFSESVTSNKIRISNLLNNLPSSDHSCLLKRFQDGGGKNEEYKHNGNPTKHKVGPMVKGLQIVTKPKIMIERLMLPQTQNQDQVNGDMSPIEVDNRLTPIPEENEHDEDPCFRHVSVRPRRTKLGKSWRLKRQEKMKKDQEREMVREMNPPIEVPYSGDSSESDDIPPTIGHMEHVSRLIKSSTLHKVDAGGEGDGVGRSSVGHHFSARPDDPLEGSSWMYTNCYRPTHEQRRSSLFKFDSSDDEDTLVEQQKSHRLLPIINPLFENETLNDSTKNKNVNKSESCNHNTLRNCPVEEPDSTNNDSEVLHKKSNSLKDSSETLFQRSSSSSTVSSTRNSPELSTDYGTANNTVEQQLADQTKMPSVRLSKVPDAKSSSVDNSFCSNRHSNVYDSPLNVSNRDSGKRIRKPANHRYPSEDYIVPNSKVKQSKIARLSSGKKSPAVVVKDKTKVVKSLKRRISTETDLKTNGDTNTDGLGVESSKHNGVNGSNRQNSSKPKTSVSKKSIHTPSSPRKSLLSHSRSSEDSRPRRNRSNLCYKESPINLKKRRP